MVNITGSGLSRTITARIANTGSVAAHNVRATVNVTSGGSPVRISGQDSLDVSIGDLAPGAAVEKAVELGFGFADGLRISQQGATFFLTVSSDEAAETFSYEYQP